MRLVRQVREDFGGLNKWKWGLPLSLFVALFAVSMAFFSLIAAVMWLLATVLRYLARLFS